TDDALPLQLLLGRDRGPFACGAAGAGPSLARDLPGGRSARPGWRSWGRQQLAAGWWNAAYGFRSPMNVYRPPLTLGDCVAWEVWFGASRANHGRNTMSWPCHEPSA